MNEQFEERDDGIYFLVLGGKPGTDLSAIGQAIRERLEAEGSANANVADCDFHAPTLACAVCARGSNENACSCGPETENPLDVVDQHDREGVGIPFEKLELH